MQLHLESVKARIDRHLVLDDLSFRLDPGESLTLLGPNGSGKTSILRCILGLLDYTGRITFGDIDLRTLGRKSIAKRIAYVPQNVPELPAYRVAEFVSLGRYAHGDRLDRQGKKQIEAALAVTGCSSLAERLVNELSGGERQRVLLATAIAQEAPLLLLDEPAASLDPEHETALYQCFEQLRREKQRAVVIASHDINRSALTSDTIIGLKQGRICFSGPANELMQNTTLEKMYGVEFSIFTHPELASSFAFPRT